MTSRLATQPAHGMLGFGAQKTIDIPEGVLAESISRIFDREMRNGYVSPSQVFDYLRSPDVLVSYTVSGEDVAGAGFTKRVSALLDVAPPEWRAAVENMTGGRLTAPFSYLSGVAVDRMFRGRGFATEICKDSLAWGREKGLGSALAFGWQDRGGCHIAGPASRAGMRSVGVIEQFWTNRSLTEGIVCPTCGNPCRCSASILFGSL